MYHARLQANLPRVRDAIRQALDRAGRTDEVTLVAVTKGHPQQAVEAALGAGLTRLGENRVQELGVKVAEAGRRAAEWHLIGHVQRNKVRSALPLFDLLHSVDSLRLARELSKEAGRADLWVDVLVQVNTSGEGTKGGFEDAEAVDAVGAIVGLPRLRVQGLMTMAPWTDDEAVLRRTFAGTRRLLEDAARQHPLAGRTLSMGMSNDYGIAIEEGATMVRLGTELFGERTS